MKPNSKQFATKTSSLSNSSNRKLSIQHHSSDETGAIAETSLKLFFSLLVSLVATVSLVRLLPYHLAQLNQLKELRAQVRETEHRVEIKRQEIEKNFDSSQINALMEEYSPRISQNRLRVFWQNRNSRNQ